MTDRIEKTIELKAPLERVWHAVTDARQFGEWFRVNLAKPFIVGEVAEGNILHPGYEHLVWKAKVVAMEPMSLFAFTWHPYGIDPKVDYSTEAPTRVEFQLEPTESGTRLTIVESGFDKVPAHRREEAFRMNNQGWTIQIENVRAYVER